MKRTWRILAFLAILALAMATPALAAPIDLAETGVDYSAVVNVTGPSGSGIVNQGVYAGLYQLLIRNPSGSAQPFNHFDAYCVDPAFAPTGTTQYDLGPIASGTPLAAAAWVLSQNYTTLAPEAQVAVWELTWGDAAFNLAAGNFILNSGFSSSQLNQVKSIYDAALVASFNPAGFSLAHNDCNQDYIVNTVPIPPSALLLGSGLLGLGLVGWKRRRQTA